MSNYSVSADGFLVDENGNAVDQSLLGTDTPPVVVNGNTRGLTVDTPSGGSDAGNAARNGGNFGGTGSNTPDVNVTPSGGSDAGNAARNGGNFGGTGSNTPSVSTNPTSLPNTGSSGGSGDIDAILTALGLKNANGYNWKNIVGAGAGALTLIDALNRPAYNPRSAKDILAGMPSNTPAFDASKAPQLNIRWGAAQPKAYAADMVVPIMPGKTYAEGGEVQGPLSQVPPPAPSGPSVAPQQPFSGAVPQEAGGGQDDLFPAQLAGGEYVMDAESVSMLGDGNTAAGVRKLDELRQMLRQQKRAAPDGQIPQPTGALSMGAK